MATLSPQFQQCHCETRGRDVDRRRKPNEHERWCPASRSHRNPTQGPVVVLAEDPRRRRGQTLGHTNPRTDSGSRAGYAAGVAGGPPCDPYRRAARRWRTGGAGADVTHPIGRSLRSRGEPNVRPAHSAARLVCPCLFRARTVPERADNVGQLAVIPDTRLATEVGSDLRLCAEPAGERLGREPPQPA